MLPRAGAAHIDRPTRGDADDPRRRVADERAVRHSCSDRSAHVNQLAHTHTNGYRDPYPYGDAHAHTHDHADSDSPRAQADATPTDADATPTEPNTASADPNTAPTDGDTAATNIDAAPVSGADADCAARRLALTHGHVAFASQPDAIRSWRLGGAAHRGGA